jgi:ubiquinol-cytochrome c reductase iron-sulfur subunit
VKERAELVPLVGFALAIVGGAGAAVVYAAGGQPQAEGVFLALSLGGIGVGLVSWAKRLIPSDIVVENRPVLGSSEEELAEVEAGFAEHDPLPRRRLLRALLVGSVGALGVALLFPVRSLGPRPGRGLKETAWREGGLRLVTADGEPVAATDLNVNGVLTVFPDGHVGAEDAQTLLLHLRPGVFNTPSGREGWAVGDQVAFSKVCTHAGCPVGLFEEQSNRLLCPCHQSTFDVSEACQPVFGPATRPLPQLPLDVDDDGFLIATGDFSAPIGPGFWDRDR